MREKEQLIESLEKQISEAVNSIPKNPFVDVHYYVKLENASKVFKKSTSIHIVYKEWLEIEQLR
jgi:hypothetical protein